MVKKEENMTVMKNDNLFKALDEVLAFSSELIILSLNGNKPEDSRVNEIRKFCDELNEAGIYKFEINCDNAQLFEQIQKFSQNING